MTMNAPSESWNMFHCENPDFFVRSVPDDVIFAVNRSSMQASEVFRDMFSFGEASSASQTISKPDQTVVDLHETSGILVALLRLIHSPPQLPKLEAGDELSEEEQMSSKLPHKVYDPATVIPLPLLSILYNLVDKYALSESIAEMLEEHLIAHAPYYPLPVYAFAVANGMVHVAAKSSQYLMPMASYRVEEIQQIPSVAAYHKVIRIQDLRVKALRDLVLNEEIFPHGYGACQSHNQDTSSRWEAKRTALAARIETMTDVAGEMSNVAQDLPKGCKTCHKACIAAVKMLAYKSRKTPRRIDQLPAES